MPAFASGSNSPSFSIAWLIASRTLSSLSAIVFPYRGGGVVAAAGGGPCGPGACTAPGGAAPGGGVGGAAAAASCATVGAINAAAASGLISPFKLTLICGWTGFGPAPAPGEPGGG